MEAQEQIPEAAQEQQLELMGDNAAPDSNEPEAQVDPDMQRALDHGWTDFETYKANGGDPEKYRGYKAFNQWADYKTSVKDETQKKLDKQSQKIDQMVEFFNKQTERQKEIHRQEIEQKLEQAKQDLDAEAIQRHATELHSLSESDRQQDHSSAQPQQGEHPAIVSFRESNPMLNRSSEDFNSDFNALVEYKFNQKANEKAQSGSFADYMIPDLAREAMDEAKQAMPHLFENKPKRTPPSVNSPSGNPSAKSPVDKLDAEAKSMYDFIKENSGQAAADEFAKNIAE